jgi:hypothetical protein
MGKPGPLSRFARMPNATPTRAIAAVLAAALVLLAPAAASAKRSVPHSFFAMNWDQEIIDHSSAKTRTHEWARMAQNGVESVRAAFFWDQAQPTSDLTAIDFTATDALVTLAASHGLELLPIVIEAPRWARESDAQFAPPRDRAAYANYLRALVARYGPNGVFWDQHKNLHKRPIRAWQIWNEPSAPYQWTIQPHKDWAPGYAKLLKVSYPAIKDADPGARVVLAGLPNTSSQDLEHLYKVGKIHGFFDVGAVHPYTTQKGGVLTLAKMFRDVMNRYGDGSKKLWVTELGLPASKGKTNDPSSLQTDDAGMAKFIKDSYKDLIKHRKKLRVDHVFGYTWASVYKGWIFKWTGLSHYTRDHGKDRLEAKPAFKTYRDLARSMEGCSKTATATCAAHSR